MQADFAYFSPEFETAARGGLLQSSLAWNSGLRKRMMTFSTSWRMSRTLVAYMSWTGFAEGPSITVCAEPALPHMQGPHFRRIDFDYGH